VVRAGWDLWPAPSPTLLLPWALLTVCVISVSPLKGVVPFRGDMLSAQRGTVLSYVSTQYLRGLELGALHSLLPHRLVGGIVDRCLA